MKVLICSASKKHQFVKDFVRVFEQYGGNRGNILISNVGDHVTNHMGLQVIPTMFGPKDVTLWSINEMVASYKIDVIIPTANWNLFSLGTYGLQQNAARVLGCDYATSLICINKPRLYRVAVQCGIPVPMGSYSFYKPVFSMETFRKIILKPADGSGSQDVSIISDFDLGNQILDRHVSRGTVRFNNKRYVWQEYKPGVEISVDCYFSKNKLVDINCRERISVSGGEVFITKTIPVPAEIRQSVVLLANDIKGFHGPVNFQFIKGQTYFLIDVNPRIPGGYWASRPAGLDLVDRMVRDVFGVDQPKEKEKKIVTCFGYTGWVCKEDEN